MIIIKIKSFQYRIRKIGKRFISGNLYMPIVRMEKNIYATLRRKLKKFLLAESEKDKYVGNHFITTQSSTNLDLIKDNSVDYIYNDPPFGANIMYSEMNLLLEGWLKIKTNNNNEAIIDESTNKTYNFYSDLMIYCFKECYRVLKPSHWMNVEFHNSKASMKVCQNRHILFLYSQWWHRVLCCHFCVFCMVCPA